MLDVATCGCSAGYELNTDGITCRGKHNYSHTDPISVRTRCVANYNPVHMNNAISTQNEFASLLCVLLSDHRLLAKSYLLSI